MLLPGSPAPARKEVAASPAQRAAPALTIHAALAVKRRAKLARTQTQQRIVEKRTLREEAMRVKEAITHDAKEVLHDVGLIAHEAAEELKHGAQDMLHTLLHASRFVSKPKKHQGLAPATAALKDAFELCDLDRSGSVSADEMVAMMMAVACASLRKQKDEEKQQQASALNPLGKGKAVAGRAGKRALKAAGSMERAATSLELPTSDAPVDLELPEEAAILEARLTAMAKEIAASTTHSAPTVSTARFLEKDGSKSLREMQIDADETVDFAEFCTAFQRQDFHGLLNGGASGKQVDLDQHIIEAENQIMLMSAAFKRADSDGTGTIEQDELKAVQKVLAVRLSEEVTQLLWDMLNPNGLMNPEYKEIDFREFLLGMAKVQFIPLGEQLNFEAIAEISELLLEHYVGEEEASEVIAQGSRVERWAMRYSLEYGKNNPDKRLPTEERMERIQQNRMHLVTQSERRQIRWVMIYSVLKAGLVALVVAFMSAIVEALRSEFITSLHLEGAEHTAVSIPKCRDTVGPAHWPALHGNVTPTHHLGLHGNVSACCWDTKDISHAANEGWVALDVFVVMFMSLLLGVVEVSSLYKVGLTSALKTAYKLGLTLSPPTKQRAEIVSMMIRCTLELGNPHKILYGIDPRGKVAGWRIALVAFLFNGKVGISKLIFKVLFKRFSSRAGARGLLPFLVIPVTVLWHCMVSYSVQMQSRLRILGVLCAVELLSEILKDWEENPGSRRTFAAADAHGIYKVEEMPAEVKKEVVRAVACAVVTEGKGVHANQEVPLHELVRRFKLPADEVGADGLHHDFYAECDDKEKLIAGIVTLDPSEQALMLRVMVLAIVLKGDTNGNDRALYNETTDATVERRGVTASIERGPQFRDDIFGLDNMAEAFAAGHCPTIAEITALIGKPEVISPLLSAKHACYRAWSMLSF